MESISGIPPEEEENKQFRKSVTLYVLIGLGVALGGYLKGIHETPPLHLSKQLKKNSTHETISQPFLMKTCLQD
ncbi:MAG TPA: hypothetical protein PKA06_13020 [Gemmatales bacterium]|nr:hypothetical protein [Gemmatales bacterium]